MSNSVQPDMAKIHKATIERILDGNKVFKSADGQRKKFIVEFTGGYKAEWCPVIGSYHLDENNMPNVMPGETVWFNVVYRKPNVNIPDEIELSMIDKNKLSMIDKNKSNGIIEGAVVQMNGHPATIAISIAKDIRCAAIRAGLKGEDVPEDTVPLFEAADEIYKWLINKANNPQE